MHRESESERGVAWSSTSTCESNTLLALSSHVARRPKSSRWVQVDAAGGGAGHVALPATLDARARARPVRRLGARREVGSVGEFWREVFVLGFEPSQVRSARRPGLPFRMHEGLS